VQAAWAGRAAAGASPVPPYRTMFGDELPAQDQGPEPARARAWVMHWEPFARLHPTNRPM
jgi:hypothetical protein